MADIFDELSKKMGLNTSSSSSTTADNDIFDQLSMSFGLTPDTRPKPTEPTMQEKISQRQLPSFDLTDSPLMQDVTKADPHLMYDKPAGPANPNAGNNWLDQNAVTRGIRDYVFEPVQQLVENPAMLFGLPGKQSLSDNPISNAIAEHTVPDAPYLNQPGTNARQSFLDRSGQEAATGASKFIGQAAAPFFVPGAGLGTGSSVRNAADNLTSRMGQGLGQTVAREAAIGGTVGFGSEYAQGQGDLGQAAITGTAGAALGGAFPLAGKGLQSIGQKYSGSKIGDYINRFFDNGTPTVEPNTAEPLALPLGRGDARLNAANDRANLPYGSEPVAPYGESPTLALPEGNYIPQQRLRVEDPTTMLNSVMTKIKPEVERIIAVPERRDLLVNYIQRHTDIPMQEIHNMPMASLQSLGQDVRQGLDIPRIAFDTARKHGYDLPALLDGQAPNVAERVAQDAQKRAYGVYPDRLPTLRHPEGFNISKTGQAAAPETKVGFRQGEMLQAPRSTLREAAQTLGRDMQPAPREPVNPATLQRGFTETLIQSEKTAPGLRERLKTAYTQIPNEVSVGQANKRVNSDLEAAASFVMSKSQTSAEKVTTAHRVIDEFSKQGNFERANDIADKIAAELTKAGQSIQAASIYNRLTPEGILVHANRIAQRVNENLPITAKEVKITPDMAASITDLAQTTQKMTGVKDLSNDVINILDKAKSGGALSATEVSTLRTFVQESKQFIKESTGKPKLPRAPQQPKDKRVRDNVVSFLDAQEAAAKERLRARGVQISSTPLDVWADYAVIGAAKMAKGAIKFAEWSEAMVKDLGESIRPQLQHLYEKSVEAFEQSTKRVTRQTISEAEKLAEKVVANKEITGPQADSIRSLAQKVSGLSGEEKRLAAQDLQSILQSLERPGTLKRVSSIQTMGQLLNPKTQVRNALGNELFYRVERVNKLLSTPIDIVRSKVTGGDRTVTFRTNNQGEYWTNWMRGLKAGWKGVNVNGLETQYDLGSPSFRGKYNPLTYMEKSLGAALKSFDTAAYMRAYNNTIGEMATLRTMNEGQRGNKELIKKYIREADDNMMKIADEYGRYVTFQDNNAISNTLVKAKRTLNLGKDFGLGDLVLKYPKTPGAILMRALEYSPAGFIRSGMILARPWMKKEPNTAEVTQALSRAMIGTFGLTGMGYFLMDSGIVTGSASKDRDVRDLQKSAGQGQYQVNLSALKRLAESGFDAASSKLKEGDLLYTYDWMQPISMAISMGANISKNMGEGKQKFTGVLGTAYNSVEGGLGTLTEQSVLQGIKRAAQGYPGQTVTDKITDILSDIPASFVPTAANQAKQLTDNSRPETYSPNKLEQSLNKAQAKIPGLAGKLPKQFDTLGRPREVYQDNNAANVLFNPGFASRYELSPEAKMVVDLINETGDEALAPRVPSKSITVDGKSVKLTGDQFSRFQKLQGEETQKAIVKRYKPGSSLKSRSKMMEDILRDSGTKARDQLKKEIK